MQLPLQVPTDHQAKPTEVEAVEEEELSRTTTREGTRGSCFQGVVAEPEVETARHRKNKILIAHTPFPIPFSWC